MKFNNYLNINRFHLLFRQDWLINKKKYGLTLIGLGLINYLFCFMILSFSTKITTYNQFYIQTFYTTCFTAYIIAVGAIISKAFPDLSDKIKTNNYLLIPASTLEKTMLQFLIRIGLFVPIALFIFWITIRFAKASLIPRDSGLDPALIPYFEYVFLITKPNGKIWDTSQIIFKIFGMFSYATCLFAGATYFKRFVLVKTMIATALLYGILISFSVLLSHIFYPESEDFTINLKKILVIANRDNIFIFFSALRRHSWLFFLPFAYYFLKEKEVK